MIGKRNASDQNNYLKINTLNSDNLKKLPFKQMWPYGFAKTITSILIVLTAFYQLFLISLLTSLTFLLHMKY